LKSIRAHFLALAIALIVLATVAFALIAYDVQRAARQQAQLQLQETANVLSLAVDGELKGALGILAALASSRAVGQREWKVVDQQARTALPNERVWIVVQDRSGRQVVNTRLPRGSILPSGTVPQQMWSELETGKPHICNLARGIVEPHIVCVDTRVRDDRGVEYAMSVVFLPRFFEHVVSRTRVKEGHVAALLDRSGTLIWRNISPAKFVGKSATPDVRAAIRSAQSGTLESTTLDGTRTIAAFNRSPLSGWSVIVGTPLESAAAGARNAQWFGSFAAVTLLTFGGLLAWLVARRLSKAVRRVGQAASSGALTRAAPASTGYQELDELQDTLRAAAAAKAQSEEGFRRIFQQTSDLIITADLDQVITDCNPSAAAAVGIPREKAIGRKISDFISPEDFQRTTQKLQEKLRAGGTTRYDVRVRNAAGEGLFWEINSGLTYDDDGNPLSLHVVARDVTERRRWERHQQLLVGELNHRVKNTLAIVQSLSHQTFRPEVSSKDAITAFEARLGALAGAHNLLTRENWEFASLREVVASALKPFCGPERCAVSGADVRLEPQTAVTLMLALHELATNAAKYGALSNDSGRLSVEWTHSADLLDFTWREEGGPAVAAPASFGFGARMIRRALAAELKADVQHLFEPTGVICQVQARLAPANTI
jgi:PAS domain S-box-containing protein